MKMNMTNQMYTTSRGKVGTSRKGSTEAEAVGEAAAPVIDRQAGVVQVLGIKRTVNMKEKPDGVSTVTANTTLHEIVLDPTREKKGEEEEVIEKGGRTRHTLCTPSEMRKVEYPSYFINLMTNRSHL